MKARRERDAHERGRTHSTTKSNDSFGITEEALDEVDHVDSTTTVVGLSRDLKKDEEKKTNSASTRRESELESTHVELLRREGSGFEG